ncbi:MAG: LUD domain-containing protein [Cytophagales bacterium]|nr:LUD domain-containing protein [Bernardetiaceae bacterium]MDW8205522.1 LUD domain-containing protein [Cytophagales bacterium]
MINSKSREQILQAIGKNKPEPAPLPNIPAQWAVDSVNSSEHLLQTFTETLQKIGAAVATASTVEAIRAIISHHYPQAVHICSTFAAVQGSVSLENIQHPAELACVEVAIVEGSLGVAENGAIWLTESQMVHRALPFITQHLVIVLPSWRIVGNMHAAYQRIGQISEGFGTFISGPSRTADIEQSLVIGAHGARSLLVCLLTS